jgi:hypothetical protein
MDEDGKSIQDITMDIGTQTGMHIQVDVKIGLNLIKYNSNYDDLNVLVEFKLPLGCVVNLYELQNKECGHIDNESISITNTTTSFDGNSAMETIAALSGKRNDEESAKSVIPEQQAVSLRAKVPHHTVGSSQTQVHFVLPLHLQYLPAVNDANASSSYAEVVLDAPTVRACFGPALPCTELEAAIPLPSLHIQTPVGLAKDAHFVGLTTDFLLIGTTLLTITLLALLR